MCLKTDRKDIKDPNEVPVVQVPSGTKTDQLDETAVRQGERYCCFTTAEINWSRRKRMQKTRGTINFF